MYPLAVAKTLFFMLNLPNAPNGPVAVDCEERRGRRRKRREREGGGDAEREGERERERGRKREEGMSTQNKAVQPLSPNKHKVSLSHSCSPTVPCGTTRTGDTQL